MKSNPNLTITSSSKNKSNSLAQVIYTLRKYVRKPKGFLPGAVIVERETGILVEPKDF